MSHKKTVKHKTDLQNPENKLLHDYFKVFNKNDYLLDLIEWNKLHSFKDSNPNG